MNYSEQQVESINKLKTQGLSGREIAKRLGLSKSGVNYTLAKFGFDGYSTRKPEKGTNVSEMGKGAKILLFDFETAADVVLTFGRFKQNISQASVIKKGHYILCASWCYSDSTTNIESIALTPEEIATSDDSRIVAKFWDLYEQSNAVVAHNSLGFDHKILQARVAYHGYPSLPSVKVLDTLVQCKKAFRLPSNKLGDVAEYFGLETKLDTGGITLWKEVQSGDVQAMKRMLSYCEQDVNVLAQVYERVKAFGNMGSSFNAGLYHEGNQKRCRTCGSADLELTGRTVDTTVSRFTEYRCAECGAVHRDRESLVTTNDRKKLLM